jgi:hypothetical protein
LKIIANNILETSTSTGIGDIVLGGAVSGYYTFSSSVSDNVYTSYYIEHDTLNEWEAGIGVLQGGMLKRLSVKIGTNGVNFVNFSAGTKQISQNASIELNINTGDTLVSEGALINSATAKTTPVDADMFGLMDSAASNILKKISWLNIKNTLNTLYQAILVSGTNIRTVNGSTLLGSTDLLAGSSICGIVSITQTASTTSYFVLNYILGGAAFASRAGRQIPMAAGTFKNLYLRLNTAQPASGSLVVSLYVNSAATAISITIAAGSAAGVYSNTANSATIANGDLVCYEVINNATASAATIQTISINHYA